MKQDNKKKIQRKLYTVHETSNLICIEKNTENLYNTANSWNDNKNLNKNFININLTIRM